MESNIVEMSKELTNILKQIQGVTGVSETVELAYIVVAKDEESKAAVSKVGEELMNQAKAHNLSLDISCYTLKEVEEANEKLKKVVKKKTAKVS